MALGYLQSDCNEQRATEALTRLLKSCHLSKGECTCSCLIVLLIQHIIVLGQYPVIRDRYPVVTIEISIRVPVGVAGFGAIRLC